MSRKHWLLCGLAVFVCASTGSSIAEEPESSPKAAAQREALTQKQIAAYRTEIQKILAKSTREITPKAGGVGLALRGYEHVALAKATDDGGTERLCTVDVEEAVAFLSTPAVTRKEK
jgi:hypothetical protein